MKIVFMLEEESMKRFLEGLLPRILPEDCEYITIAHEGKTDLERSIPRKLRAWRTPETKFVVIRDQDGGDCRKIKARLRELCATAGRPEASVCIACRELESWLLGDLAALGEAFSMPEIGRLQDKAKFRDPDRLGSPCQELLALIPNYGKVTHARYLGPRLPADGSRSRSYAYFVQTVRKLVGDA